ncbi:MAG: hypothetical protein PHX63_06395, partial [Eubacteriales bacterium]|nr:hypothetical protein [Eubacteriales bacterium]
FEVSAGVITEDFLSRFFLRPNELLAYILERENAASTFKGDFFDSLRLLAKMEGQTEMKEAIASLLKHFDALVNRENSLNSILKQTETLLSRLPKSAAEQVNAQLEQLKLILYRSDSKTGADNSGRVEGNFREVINFLKNTFIPTLSDSIRGYQTGQQARENVLAIIHHIVRFDKSDTQSLYEAIQRLGNELKPLTNITDRDIREMRELVFEHAKQLRGKNAGVFLENLTSEKAFAEKLGLQQDKDIAALLSRALESDSPAKVSSVAQNLLMHMVQSESPILPILHFLVPFRFLDENTYGEFFIDKDCSERKGEAKEAKGIFFIIQSDKYGNFEVDLLARDKAIDLDIRCPESILDRIKDEKGGLARMITEQGYVLSNYKVDIYRPGQTIIQRFPKLATGKVGIDVKV